MAHEQIRVEYEEGPVDKVAMENAAKAVADGIDVLSKKFDGKKVAQFQLALNDLSKLVNDYCQKLISVSNGITSNRFKVNDTIQTLDKGARDSAGRIVDFSSDGYVAKYLKSNGTFGEVHVTYIKHF